MEPLKLLTDLVFGGVLERFPKLRVVLAEYDLSWLHPFLSKMDGTLQRARSEAPDSPTVALLPSEVIRRQVSITFQDDRIGVLGTDVFNMESISSPLDIRRFTARAYTGASHWS